MSKFTRNDVIQQQNQERLIQFGQNDTASCFSAGDIVNAEWENAIRNGWDKPCQERDGDYVTRRFICAAAGYYYGKSERTMRYYADIANIVSSDLRDEFHMLSFAHFAKARKYDNWLDYLEYARSGGLDGGIVSVDGCEAEWLKKHQEKIATIEVETQEDERHTDNRFSFANVCKHAMTMLDRFADDPRISQAIELIKSAIADSVPS